MKENPNIIVTFLAEGISRIKINEPGNYNALSLKTTMNNLAIELNWKLNNYELVHGKYLADHKIIIN